VNKLTLLALALIVFARDTSALPPPLVELFHDNTRLELTLEESPSRAPDTVPRPDQILSVSIAKKGLLRAITVTTPQSRSELWIIGTTVYSRNAAGKVTSYEIDGTQPWYLQPDCGKFFGTEWITPEFFKTVEVKQGKKCLVFENGLTKSWIDSETHLPVSLTLPDGTFTCSVREVANVDIPKDIQSYDERFRCEAPRRQEEAARR
jgi:hypothetical protein